MSEPGRVASPGGAPATRARSRGAVVTIDGPAGSGKTTLGRRVAAALGLPLVDTGLFYRGLTVAAWHARVDAADPGRAEALARSIRVEVNADPCATAGTWRVRVDGRDVTEEARDPARARLLAELSAVAGVRGALLPAQREAARAGAVAVGRDCGTVVFPGAVLKIYVDAPAAERARRRGEQLRVGGVDVDASGLRAEVAERDEVDSGRTASPLQPAPDAHMIDTGRLGIEETVAEALRLCRRAGLLPTAEG